MIRWDGGTRVRAGGRLNGLVAAAGVIGAITVLLLWAAGLL